MSNSLTPLSPTYWSNIMGIKLYKENVALNLCSRKEEGVLKNGQIVDRPYRADIYVDKYTKGTALTAQDISATSDTLTVDQIFAALIYVDDVDKIQNKWDAAEAWSSEVVTRLSNQIDASILFTGAYGANDSVDYNDIDSTQTAGVAIPLTVSNVLKLFTTTKRKLTANNVPQANRFIVISSEVEEVLMTYIAGRESILGDKTGESGNLGSYMGLDIYVSNNLTGMVRWTPTDNPSNAETLIIDGVTLTFMATLGSTAGNVHIASDTAHTLDILVAAINAPGTTVAEDTDTGYVALTGSNLAKANRGWFAVDGTTYIDIYFKGGSYPVVAGTAQATLTYEKQLCLAGEKKAIDVVIQQNPSVKMASTVSAGKDGMNILPKALWGTKVFHDMAVRLLRIEIDSSGY